MGKYGIRPAAGPWHPGKAGRLASGFFLAGFLAGLVLIFAGQESLVQGSSYLDSVSLAGIGALRIDRRGLFLYSLKQRLAPAGTGARHLGQRGPVYSSDACFFFFMSPLHLPPAVPLSPPE